MAHQPEIPPAREEHGATFESTQRIADEVRRAHQAKEPKPPLSQAEIDSIIYRTSKRGGWQK